MTQEKFFDKTFIVDLWSRIFDFLGKLTMFYIFLYIIQKTRAKENEERIGKYGFVEIWVIFFTIISFLCMLFSKSPKVDSLEWGFIIIGCWRLYEIVIYQINVVFFAHMRDRRIRGYLRIVLLLFHNFFEITFWFAFFYRNLTETFRGGEINSFINSLIFSFYTMTTFGHTTIIPECCISKIVTFIQSLIGLFMALVVLSSFISYLPIPDTTEEEKK